MHQKKFDYKKQRKYSNKKCIGNDFYYKNAQKMILQ